MLIENSFTGGVNFVDGFETSYLTATNGLGGTLNFAWQQSVTNVYSVRYCSDGATSPNAGSPYSSPSSRSQ